MAEFLRLVPKAGSDYCVLADIKALIREYEAGEREMPLAFVFVTESENGLSHGAFGLLDAVHAIGMHTTAAHLLVKDAG